jgi:hypothetical protein
MGKVAMMDMAEDVVIEVGEVLRFSAHSSLYPNEVSLAVAFRRKDGSKCTFYMNMSAERALGYSEKLSAAVNAALIHAPRRAG